MKFPKLYTYISAAISAAVATASSYAVWKWLVTPRGSPREPLRVLITGAAGQIGYALAPAIASGQMFGPDQPVILHLFDIPPAADSLQGLRLELIDGAYPLLVGVVATTSLTEACQGAAVAVMLAGAVKRPQMDRRDLIAANLGIYCTTATALQEHALPNVKVVVVAGPANTNAYMLHRCAPRLAASNITALTRLDHNRALAHLAEKVGVPIKEVTNVIIWGTPATSQLPYAHLARVGSRPLSEMIPEAADYLDNEFVSNVQQRGLNVMKLRRLSPALSAARAICDHTRDWLQGTPAGTWVSMAVVSAGHYGIQPGLVYSFPVTCHKGDWSVVPGLPIDAACWAHMKLVEADLQEDQALVLQLLRQQQQQGAGPGPSTTAAAAAASDAGRGASAGVEGQIEGPGGAPGGVAAAAVEEEQQPGREQQQQQEVEQQQQPELLDKGEGGAVGEPNEGSSTPAASHMAVAGADDGTSSSRGPEVPSPPPEASSPPEAAAATGQDAAGSSASGEAPVMETEVGGSSDEPGVVEAFEAAGAGSGPREDLEQDRLAVADEELLMKGTNRPG